MSLEVDDISWKTEYQFQVSNLWSVLDRVEMDGVDDWLSSTGIRAEYFKGYGDIRFYCEEDRTLFLLRYLGPNNPDAPDPEYGMTG